MPHHASFTSAVLTVVSLLSLLLGQQAQAATLFSGSSAGSFGKPTVNPQTDPDALFSIENNAPQSETFVLGEADAGSMPNRLTFTGKPFETTTNEAFAVGELSYFNGRTFIGTNVSSVPMDVSLAFTQPLITQRRFGYRFDFDLTPNVNASNDDRLVVSQNPEPEAFTAQDNSYRIELLGFSQNNGATFTRSFQTPEDELISTTLFAQIKPASVVETNPPPSQSVPEPTAVLGIIGLGSTMLLRRYSVYKTSTEQGAPT